MVKIGKSLLAGLFFMLACGLLYSRDNVTFQFAYTPGAKYKLTEVAGLRRRVNGKYSGFTYKQLRGVLEVEAIDDGTRTIAGDFFIFQETKRNTTLIANQVDRIVPVRFTLSPQGTYQSISGGAYPTSRDFPVFPTTALSPGDSWQAHGIRYVEPFGDGVFTRVPFYCDYTYRGIDSYKGIPSHLITAQYALRYKKGQDREGDERLKEIRNGGHKVTLYIGVESGQPLFMKDQIIENLGGEHYLLSDGSTITLRGFTQTWYDTIPVMDKENLIQKLKKQLPGKEGILVDEQEDGVRLSLPEIRFYPDSPQILPGEQNRLQKLYQLLSGINGRTFLISGHTADVGTAESQYKLSVERAKAIADYLMEQGIQSRQLLYEGKGGTEPLAPNDNEADRAKNRRVEVTILED